jgi:hypothetical protein
MKKSLKEKIYNTLYRKRYPIALYCMPIALYASMRSFDNYSMFTQSLVYLATGVIFVLFDLYFSKWEDTMYARLADSPLYDANGFQR